MTLVPNQLEHHESDQAAGEVMDPDDHEEQEIVQDQGELAGEVAEIEQPYDDENDDETAEEQVRQRPARNRHPPNMLHYNRMGNPTEFRRFCQVSR